MQDETTHPDRVDICKLAYDESTKGLALQDATLSSIRQSSTVLVTLSGLTATFLGKEVLGRLSKMPCTDICCWLPVWVAFIALGLSLLFVVLILLPRDGWIFHFAPSSILDQFAKKEAVVSLEETYEVLARFNEDNYKANEALLRKLFVLLYALMVAVVAQITAWLISLL